jgi:phospholipase D1/2
MQVVGQPARDLARHFVERFVPTFTCAEHIVELPSHRWNYLLHLKVCLSPGRSVASSQFKLESFSNHAFLLPPPEFKPEELGVMGLTGTDTEDHAVINL